LRRVEQGFRSRQESGKIEVVMVVVEVLEVVAVVVVMIMVVVVPGAVMEDGEVKEEEEEGTKVKRLV
jgi:hypothetical protein